MTEEIGSVYRAAPTLKRFHKSDAFVRALMGPIGSGKSVACVAELMRKARTQRPNAQGIRKSRWVAVRNSYRELEDTLKQTFFDWVGLTSGTYRTMDNKWSTKFDVGDGTTVELEVLFRALDRPDDVKKLLSLEVTGGWLNEAREIPKQVLDMLQGRVGRYPSKRDGGASWFGVIMDTNPPDSDHWFYRLFEEDRPENFELFKQPSGLSAEAENIDNLPANYYSNMLAGKDQEWVNVYVHGNYGFITDGKPVWPEYKDDVHASPEEILLFGGNVYVGIDFGLTPAAVFGQLTPGGQMQIIDELVTEDMGAVSFGKLLNEKLQREYCGCETFIYADPAGEQRSQTDETTPFQILWNQGIMAWPAYTNDFTVRREAVADYMLRLDFTGKPAFTVSPKAAMLRKALAGGYKYKRMQVSGEARFQDVPMKNKYSHVADALQYLMLGAVGGDRVVGGFGEQKIDYNQTNRLVT